MMVNGLMICGMGMELLSNQVQLMLEVLPTVKNLVSGK